MKGRTACVLDLRGLALSPHQRQGPCPMCEDDASRHNHCSWCGMTFGDRQTCHAHLAAGCGEKIADAVCAFFGLTPR